MFMRGAMMVAMLLVSAGATASGRDRLDAQTSEGEVWIESGGPESAPDTARASQPPPHATSTAGATLRPEAARPRPRTSEPRSIPWAERVVQTSRTTVQPDGKPPVRRVISAAPSPTSATRLASRAAEPVPAASPIVPAPEPPRAPVPGRALWTAEGSHPLHAMDEPEMSADAADHECPACSPSDPCDSGGYGSPCHDWWCPPCNLGQHQPYAPALHGTYYFRPYHPSHLRQQQEAAVGWGGDASHPYSSEVFERVYADYQPAARPPKPAPEEAKPKPKAAKEEPKLKAPPEEPKAKLKPLGESPKKIVPQPKLVVPEPAPSPEAPKVLQGQPKRAKAGSAQAPLPPVPMP